VVNIGDGGVLGNRYGHFVKDGGAMVPYSDMAAPYVGCYVEFLALRHGPLSITVDFNDTVKVDQFKSYFDYLIYVVQQATNFSMLQLVISDLVFSVPICVGEF
ncbi:hypothetical protein A2U01_0030255, partial [Trifolium medium]|nr:hypothetical protein [Trifolium medium]